MQYSILFIVEYAKKVFLTILIINMKKIKLKLKTDELRVLFKYAEAIRQFLLKEKRDKKASLLYAEMNVELECLKELEKRILIKLTESDKIKSFAIKPHEGFLFLKYQLQYEAIASEYEKVIFNLQFPPIWKFLLVK